MFTKNHLLTGLILVTISKVITIAPANALPDGPPPQSNFVPDDSANFFSGSFVNSPGGQSLTNSISIPPGISAADVPGGVSSSSDGSSSIGDITVADIADYLTSSIDRSLDDLNTADVAQKPRRIVRRRRAVCPNPQISRSSEKLEDLLNQSEQFIQEIKQIKPENNIW